MTYTYRFSHVFLAITAMWMQGPLIETSIKGRGHIKWRLVLKKKDEDLYNIHLICRPGKKSYLSRCISVSGGYYLHDWDNRRDLYCIISAENPLFTIPNVKSETPNEIKIYVKFDFIIEREPKPSNPGYMLPANFEIHSGLTAFRVHKALLTAQFPGIRLILETKAAFNEIVEHFEDNTFSTETIKWIVRFLYAQYIPTRIGEKTLRELHQFAKEYGSLNLARLCENEITFRTGGGPFEEIFYNTPHTLTINIH